MARDPTKGGLILGGDAWSGGGAPAGGSSEVWTTCDRVFFFYLIVCQRKGDTDFLARSVGHSSSNKVLKRGGIVFATELEHAVPSLYHHRAEVFRNVWFLTILTFCFLR